MTTLASASTAVSALKRFPTSNFPLQLWLRKSHSHYIIIVTVVNPKSVWLRSLCIYLTCSQSEHQLWLRTRSHIHYWKLLEANSNVQSLFEWYVFPHYSHVSESIYSFYSWAFKTFCFCRFLECFENSGCLSGWQHSQHWVQPYWFLLWQECVMFSFASHPVCLIHLE